MMHPRRLKGSPGNIARYYAIGDYYTKGDAERSSWGGTLASELGLAGDVDPETFRALLAGKVAGQQLGRHRADGIQHHPGWDFAISAPKSVSVMALAMGDERIAQLHERSVDVALAYRSELAHGLRELGYDIDFDPRRGLFEIRGVPKALIKEMSQRAEQINEHAQQHGLFGQASRRQSFYATRSAKVKIGIDTLLIQWRGRLGPHEKPLEAVRQGAARSGEHPVPVDRADAARAALFGIRQSEGKEAVNPLGRLYTTGLASHVGAVRFQDLRPPIDAHEERRKLLTTRGQTGDQVLTRGRTTRRTVRVEQSLAMHLALAVGDGRPVASTDRLLPVLERAGLSPPQERALVDMAISRDRVTGLHGVAGAGKSTLVRSLKDAALPGKTFIALAPTSSAAAELGDRAQIESRTVASLLAGRGYGISGNHVLVLDEAGQLGSRQALQVLEISRSTGARLILLGDNKQTGAIEQGKAFWLMQKLGMETAELTESRRQETVAMRQAVSHARGGDYAASIGRLDKVMDGEDAATLAAGLVAEWTRLSPRSRAATNILVLDNASRLIVNSKIREILQREGVVAADEIRLSVLTPGGLSDQEKRMPRFYSGGQVVTFGRDQPGAGLGRDAEYRVVEVVRDARGRQLVRLVDEQGRVHLWDPRTGKSSQINVFMDEKRDLSEGDRIQWRLASRELQLNNAERGRVEKLEGPLATIRWDRSNRVQTIDLSRHKTWDHGYAETIYSAQSKTYDRVYVLAPVGSPLVTAQNFYTAITRARHGVKLWTQDPKKLVERLEERSGEKTSGLEGLGRLERDHRDRMAARQGPHLQKLKDDQDRERRLRSDRQLEREIRARDTRPQGVADKLAGRAQQIFEALDQHLQSLLSDRHSNRNTAAPEREQQTRDNGREGGRGLDR